MGYLAAQETGPLLDAGNPQGSPRVPQEFVGVPPMKTQMKAKKLNSVKKVKDAADTKEKELRGLQKVAKEQNERISAVEKNLKVAMGQNKQLTDLSQDFRNKISKEMTEMKRILQIVENEAGNQGENLRLDGINKDLDDLFTLIIFILGS